MQYIISNQSNLISTITGWIRQSFREFHWLDDSVWILEFTSLQQGNSWSHRASVAARRQSLPTLAKEHLLEQQTLWEHQYKWEQSCWNCSTPFQDRGEVLPKFGTHLAWWCCWVMSASLLMCWNALFLTTAIPLALLQVESDRVWGMFASWMLQ